MIKVKTIDLETKLQVRCWGCYNFLTGGQIYNTMPFAMDGDKVVVSSPIIGVAPCKICIDNAIEDHKKTVGEIKKDG